MKSGFMRRLLSIVFTFVIVLTMVPVAALRTNAATGPFTSFTVGGTNVNGTQSGSNWSYDASSLTLTITGNIGSSTGSLAVNAPTAPNSNDVLTVRVTKNATVKGGIYVGGKLHLVVDPGVTLKVDASGMDNAIHADYAGGVNNTLKISGGGTVYAVSKGYGMYGKSGIWIEGVTVAAKGSVYGLFSGNNGSIYIQDNSKVYAEASSNGDLHAAIATGTGNAAKLYIYGKNTVVIAGFALGSEANGFVPNINAAPVAARGIYTSDTYINCGHIVFGGTVLSSDASGYRGMVSVNSTDQRYQFVGHMSRYVSSGDGATHTLCCAEGCPIPVSGATENCSGGTADCAHKAVCSKCGQGHGSTNPDNHSEKTAANCLSPAICQWCNQPYGSINKSNHTGTVTEWEYVDPNNHLLVYSCCGTAANRREAHTPSTDNAHVCSKCGEAYTSCIDNNNDHVCETCGAVSSCKDESHDHLCDICAKTLSDCADNDGNNVCDTCGKLLSSVGYVEYSWDGTKLVATNKTVEQAYAILSTSQSLSAGWYVVKENVTVAERLEISGTVNIILTDGATLTAQQGIEVPGGTTLNIYAQAGGTGKLIAQNGGLRACAIGSTNSGTTGTINIHGGNITATIDNGRYSSAIGSGVNGTGGAVTIYNGNITASGGDNCAGIGSGYDAESVDITIYGGTINATGGACGAGIGGGFQSNGKNITIYGGDITATGGRNASGIGGGYCAAAGNITIYDGTIVATAGSYGAGIGSGYNYEGDQFTNTGTITIHGGTVTATGGAEGAGIGGGSEAAGATVVITGGNVKAVAGRNAEAIGKGYGGTASGTLKDASGNDLTLVTITLYGVTEQVAVTQVEGVGSYGLKDVKTLDTNKLYFYLPSTSNPTSVTANGKPYVGTIENGAGTFYDHIHSWTYAASGDTVTATCSNADGDCYNTNGGSVTISAPESVVYTGSALTPATLTYSDNWVGEKKENTDIAYENNTNAGQATASISLNRQTVAVTFEIKQAGGAITGISDISKTYDGTAVTAPTFTSLSKGAATIEYKVVDTDDSTYTTTAPVNAGVYTVRISVAADQNYKAASATVQFRIDPIVLDKEDFDFTLSQDTFVYNRAPQKPDVTVTYNGLTLTEGTDYDLWYLDVSHIRRFEQGVPTGFFYGTHSDSVNSGQYYAVVMFIGNYKNAAYNEFFEGYTIEKAPVVEPSIADKPYTGSVQTAAITDTDLYTVETNIGGTDVGSYDVVLKLVDADNYKWNTTDEAETTLQFQIAAAENSWASAPAISGWTYGQSAKTPTAEAKFGTYKVVYTGKANDGTDYSSQTAPTKAGSYTATFTVEGTDNYGSLSAKVDFTVAKANYDLSAVRWDYSEAFKYDGLAKTVAVTNLPEGLTALEYSGNTATKTGEYSADVSFDYDHYNYNKPFVDPLAWKIENNWTPTEFSLSVPNENGWLKGDFVITAAAGYKVSLTDTANGVWSDALTYADETADGSVTFYLKKLADGTISLGKTVAYKLDKTPAAGKVVFAGRAGWEDFVHTITFGLFYKEKVTVQVEATDSLSGIASIDYAAGHKGMTLEKVKAITDWTAYTRGVGVALEDAKQFVYYVRITDKAGNVTYLSTNGAVYDITAPVISGVENGKTYYTTQEITVTDRNIKSITLNDEAVTGNITLEGNRAATYTIVATDKAGNTTTVTVTTKPISDLAAPIDQVTKENVNSGNGEAMDSVKAAVEAVDTTNATGAEKEALKAITEKTAELETVIDDTRAQIDGIKEQRNKLDEKSVNSDDAAPLAQLAKDIQALTDGNNLTEAERATLTEAANDVAAMQKTVEDARNAMDTDSTEKVKDVTAENATPEDKANLQKAKADLEKVLADYGDNYTESEKQAINNQIQRIEDALLVLKDALEAKIVTGSVIAGVAVIAVFLLILFVRKKKKKA